MRHHPLDQEADHDAVMDQLHAELAAWLSSLGDPFLERGWTSEARALQAQH